MGLLGRKWVQIGLIWFVIAFALVIWAILGGSAPRVNGDDAMRLVGAIDLFNGQSWFDTVQHRDNAPFGAEIHFSRLVDAPIALLILLFTPVAHAAAPLWAAFVWPLLVLLVVVFLLAEVTGRVAGANARWPALGLLAMSVAIYTEFVPGRVDHHNVQIALTLAMILSAINGRYSAKWAILAGLATATALAVGTESLPSVIAAIVCFALYWVVDPWRSRTCSLAFATSFAVTLALHLMAMTPPSYWLVPACDALSSTYVLAGIAFAAAMLVAVLLSPRLRSMPVRFAVLALLGALVLGIVLWHSPSCRFGPYGDLDADLAKILLTEIGEAQPLWVWVWGSQFRQETALALTPIFGTLAVFVVTFLVRPQDRWRWLVLSGYCVALFLVFCLQIRGFRLLSIAILPGPAWLVAQAWSKFRASQSIKDALGVAVLVFAFSGAAHIAALAYALAPATSEAPPDLEALAWAACAEPDAYEQLANLPAGQVMNYMLIGTPILLHTPHQIVTAGYHRNEAGLRDMVRFYSGGEAEARAVAEERDLDYLVFCRGLAPNNGLAGLEDFNGLSWPWLTRVSPADAPLQIYTIDLTR